MALPRTAMCRNSAPCSHSANGQTADRHLVCPSAVWPFLRVGSRRGRQNVALWPTQHAEENGRAPGSLQKLATVSTPWRRKVRPEPNVVAQWRSRAHHLSTAQLSRAVHVVLLRALPLERGAKENFRLPLSGVPRACRLQCNSFLHSKRLCLIALRSSTIHYP